MTVVTNLSLMSCCVVCSLFIYFIFSALYYLCYLLLLLLWFYYFDDLCLMLLGNVSVSLFFLLMLPPLHCAYFFSIHVRCSPSHLFCFYLFVTVAILNIFFVICSDWSIHVCIFWIPLSRSVGIPYSFIDPYLFRLRYRTLLWECGTQKIDEEMVSESETTGKVISRVEAMRVDRKYIPVGDSVDVSKFVTTNNN